MTRRKKISITTSKQDLQAARRELIKLRFRKACGEAVAFNQFKKVKKTAALCLTLLNQKRGTHAKA